MNEQNFQDKPNCSTTCHKISWTAVIAGAFVAFGLSFLLNLMSISLGFSLIGIGSSSVTTGITTFIWVLITAYLAMMTAGITAGYLAKQYHFNCWSGVLHGFLAWCIGLFATLMLTAHFSLALPINIQSLTLSNDNRVVAVSSATTSKHVSATVDEERAAAALAKLTMEAFLIFLIGALSSSVGGYFGMRCAHEQCSTDDLVKSTS